MTRSRLTVCAALWLAPVCAASGPANGAPPVATLEPPVRSSAESNVVSPPNADAEARLEAILQDWEKALSKRHRLETSFLRVKYDQTWQIEQRGTGSLGIDTDGRGYYEVTPATINPSEQSRKLTNDGTRYSLRSAPRDRWYFSAKSIIRVTDVGHTFVEMLLPLRLGDALKLSCAESSLPPQQPDGDDLHPDPPALPEEEGTLRIPISPGAKTKSSSKNSTRPDTKDPTFVEAAAGFVLGVAICAALWNTDFDADIDSDRFFPVPKPFFLGMPTAELKEQFHVKLLKETGTEVWLQLTPKKSRDGERAILILSHDGYNPVAIKQFDPTGTVTVHVFTDVHINPRDACFFNRFVRPNLKGYRRL